MKPKSDTLLDGISSIDWARLAAFIDGEGCIRIASVRGINHGSRRIFYLEVTVVNTDPRLGQWLLQTFGGSVHTSKRATANRKPLVAWVVSSRHAASILSRAAEYFIIKREQVDTALAFQATIISDRRYGRSGRPMSVVEGQRKLQERLQDLKGTSSRGLRNRESETVQ